MSDIPPFQRRKSRGGTRSMSEKTDMPRYAADVSITNYEAVSGYFGHWLHRAQVSLLTGKIGQIKLSHSRKKNPGAGLVRAWCGPGAGLVRAWCGPGAGLVRAWCGPGAGLARAGSKDRSRGAGLALRNLLMAGVRTEWYSTALGRNRAPCGVRSA